MKTLIVYAHPNPKSFNAAIKETLVSELQAKGHEVKVRDLYAMNFNPVLNVDDFNHYAQKQIPADVKAEQDGITWADHVVFLYPTWWIGMPAILKGYIDRVFTNGFAFSYTENGAEGLLKGKKALVIQTTGQPLDLLKQYNLLSPMEVSVDHGILGFTGIEVITHQFFGGVPYSSDDDRKRMLEEVKGIAGMLGEAKEIAAKV